MTTGIVPPADEPYYERTRRLLERAYLEAEDPRGGSGFRGGRGAVGANPAPHRLRRGPGRDLSRRRMRQRAADGEPRRVGRRRRTKGRALRSGPDPHPGRPRPGTAATLEEQDLRRQPHGLGAAATLRLRAHRTRVRPAQTPSGDGRTPATRLPRPRRTPHRLLLRQLSPQQPKAEPVGEILGAWGYDVADESEAIDTNGAVITRVAWTDAPHPPTSP